MGPGISFSTVRCIHFVENVRQTIEILLKREFSFFGCVFECHQYLLLLVGNASVFSAADVMPLLDAIDGWAMGLHC